MRAIGFPAFVALSLAVASCATAPKTASERSDLQARAETTLRTMQSRDASLKPLLDSAYGYAVFPDIGKGGFVAGGAHGRGVVFEQGRPTGFVQLSQASLGAQIGAQTFAELIVFADRESLQRLKQGNFSISGNASAVVLTTGAAASTRYANGIAVFVMPRGGVMAELSVSGQQINYEPIGG